MARRAGRGAGAHRERARTPRGDGRALRPGAEPADDSVLRRRTPWVNARPPASIGDIPRWRRPAAAEQQLEGCLGLAGLAEAGLADDRGQDLEALAAAEFERDSPPRSNASRGEVGEVALAAERDADVGDEADARVACLGDSITYGRPFAREPYPARLQGLATGRAVLQHGVSGETTAEIRARWSRRVRPLRPDTLVVQGGVNDLHGDVPAAEVYANLSAIYVEATADGIRVVAVTLLPFGGEALWTPARQAQAEALNELIRRTAGVTVVDAYAAMGEPGAPERLRARYDAGDGLHPSDAGAAALALMVDEALP